MPNKMLWCFSLRMDNKASSSQAKFSLLDLDWKRWCERAKWLQMISCWARSRIPDPASPLTLASCCSEAKPRPKTVLARLSAHWPNFCDVFVKVMFGVMVLLIITWRDKITVGGVRLLKGFLDRHFKIKKNWQKEKNTLVSRAVGTN